MAKPSRLFSESASRRPAVPRTARSSGRCIGRRSAGRECGRDDFLPRVAIKLQSEDDRFQTSTDAQGVYSIYDVLSGKYDFTAKLPHKCSFAEINPRRASAIHHTEWRLLRI